jgi:hypothetical protein
VGFFLKLMALIIRGGYATQTHKWRVDMLKRAQSSFHDILFKLPMSTPESVFSGSHALAWEPRIDAPASRPLDACAQTGIHAGASPPEKRLRSPKPLLFRLDVQDKSWTPTNFEVQNLFWYLCIRECAGAWER